MRRQRAGRTVLFVVLAIGVSSLSPAVVHAAGPALDVRTTGGAPIDTYNYLVNDDNTANPAALDPFQRPGYKPDASHSPVVHTGKVSPGNSADATLPTLPAGKYLITVRAPGYKLWGRHVTLPAAGPLRIELSSDNVPAANLVAHVFHDNQSVNAAPDIPLETGLGGFDVIVEDTLGQVTVDINGDPLCGGQCLTDADGNVTIHNLPPGKYEVQAIPPDGEGWIQTSTFEGMFSVGAWLEEGSNGRGPEPGALTGPPGTAHWFGFVKEKALDPGPNTGTITGTARTWEPWPKGAMEMGEPIADPYIALSNLGGNDDQVYTGRGNPDGTFEITDVPPGTYQMSIWDYNLDWVIRLITVTVTPGQLVELGDVGAMRWFGWVSGSVFTDNGAGGGIAGDGIRQPGEPGIRGMDLDERWRDGSVQHGTFTGTDGRYEFAESLGPLSKFSIAEVGFGRFARTGISVTERGQTTKVPDDVGGGLLAAQLTQFGHRSEIDFGKLPYASGENGGITGIVYYATTRNEYDARLAAAEDYEPGIPGVTVKLSSKGPDGEANTVDDVLLNQVETDSWKHPSDCDVRDFAGTSLASLAFAEPTCLEYAVLSNETKDGAFDGGYAIETMCPPDADGNSTFPCDDAAQVPLPPDEYVVEAVAPHGYQIVKEENQNTSEGDTIVPQIPPPPCVGDLHLVEMPDSPYDGQDRPLCNKRLVTLEDRQNAASDFFFFTDNEVPVPGRIVGLILNDVTFEQDPNNVLFGEGQGEKMPIGVYDYADRLITTVNSDVNGGYEVLLPSTYTASCPTPSGVCPGMYKLMINDPGTKANPNAGYNPNVIGQTVVMDVWPGKTSYADTPVIPRSEQTCKDNSGPEVFQVSKIQIPTNATGAARSFVILGRDFGTSPTVTLGGTPITVTGNTTGPNGAQQLTVSVPTANMFNGFAVAGPRQLRVTAAGRTTVNGLTFHLRGAGYNPTVSPVSAGGSIQAAINAAPTSGDTLIDVAPGIYKQNVVLNKRVKLQGHGPGGFIGTQGLPNEGAEVALQQTAGSVIDGRYVLENQSAWNATVSATQPFAGNQNVPAGAAVTVIAKGGAFTSGFPAAIDGFGITNGDGAGAGGVHVNGFARSLRITNNIFESNAGEYGGAIALGLPQTTTGVANNENDDVVMRFNRILGNGGRNKAGGIGIYNGADNYTLSDNDICANSSFEYGGGISHFGNSPNGAIADNRIMYNSSFDEGGGILVGGELGIGGPNGNGSGPVNIERNLIEQNLANDDGGGVEVLNALTFRVTMRNNLVVNNVATDVGGGIAVDDSSDLRLVNNTVGRNQTTATAEDSDGNPHGAGLAAHPFTPGFRATLPTGSPSFPNPVMFNNIFWENRAFTADPAAESGLTERAVIDLEVVNPLTPSAFTPRWSLLTAPHGTPSGSNLIGQNPQFVNPFETNAQATPGPTAGPGGPLQVSITPPDGPPDVPGNYHLQGTSPAIDRGARCSNTAFPAPANALNPCTGGGVAAPSGMNADIDGQYRPMLRTLRTRTPWDIGADELIGLPVPLS